MLYCVSKVESACGRERRKAEKKKGALSVESEGKEELMKKGKQGLCNAIHMRQSAYNLHTLVPYKMLHAKYCFIDSTHILLAILGMKYSFNQNQYHCSLFYNTSTYSKHVIITAVHMQPLCRILLSGSPP